MTCTNSMVYLTYGKQQVRTIIISFLLYKISCLLFTISYFFMTHSKVSVHNSFYSKGMAFSVCKILIRQIRNVEISVPVLWVASPDTGSDFGTATAKVTNLKHHNSNTILLLLCSG